LPVDFVDGVFALLGRDQQRVIAAYEPGLDASPRAMKDRCRAALLSECAYASLAEGRLQLVDELRAQERLSEEIAREGLIPEPFGHSGKPILAIDQDFNHALYCRI
jgi:hypothetical protein